MEYLETIEECDEPEDESFFLIVKRPGRKSCSVIKHSTPGRSEVSEFTVSTLCEKSTTGDVLITSKSRINSQGLESYKQMVLNEEISLRGESLSVIQSFQEDLSLKTQEPQQAFKKSDRLRSLFEKFLTDANSPSQDCVLPARKEHVSERRNKPAVKLHEIGNSTQQFSSDGLANTQKWKSLGEVLKTRKSHEKALPKSTQGRRSLARNTPQHYSLFQMGTSTKKSRPSKAQKLRAKLRVREWVIRQLENIEAATQHELLIE
ncbi:uncharacterized protein LOC136768675 isoform X2 [Amia ocellicauda]